MPPLELFYPVKDPINQSNLFGTPGPIYTASGQKGHPGIDFECPLYTPVYAPCDGDAFYVTDFAALVKDGLIPADAAPEKAGCGIWIRTPNDAAPQANIILWHMVTKFDTAHPYQIPTDGSLTPVKCGQLLGYSGDTGYPIETNGPHLHAGYMPCDKTGEALNPANGFKGCENPLPLFNGKFAQDVAIEEQVIAKSSAVVQLVSQATDTQVSHQEKLNVLQAIEQFIKTLIP